MKLISRSELGWPPSAAADWPTAKGVKVHYEGTPVHITDHSQCASHWTAIRNSHLANTAEGYVDVAYNFAVCLHGYVLEGRGLHKKTGANGNRTLNSDHYSVVAFLGDSGDTQPTVEMIQGLRDAIAYFQENGAGKEIKGHRDGYATSCPGEPLYALVTSGALAGGVTTPVTPAPNPSPAQSSVPWPGIYVGTGSSNDTVRRVQQRLKDRGWTIAVDGDFGPKTRAVVVAFQQEKGLQPDGIVGPKTWDAMFRTDNIT